MEAVEQSYTATTSQNTGVNSVSNAGVDMTPNSYEKMSEICQSRNGTENPILPVCFTENGKSFSDILTYFLMFCVGIIMFSMGCKVKIRELWKRFRFPYGILLGALCQFGLMPLIAFTLAKLFNLSQGQALAVIIMGCIPGGSASNLFSYWCGGDMDLSIAMTAFSTIVAFVMMPACLYLYGRALAVEKVGIPFGRTAIVLLSFVVPISMGAALNYWKPKIASKIAKIGAVFGVIIIIVAAALGIILYPGAWDIPLSFWIVGAILPMSGYVGGFVVSYLTGRLTKFEQVNQKQIRTIAIETGMQNTQMCAAIIQLNYNCTCLILEMFAYPLVYFVYEIGEALLLCIVYKIYKHSRKDNKLTDLDDANDINDERERIENSKHKEYPEPLLNSETLAEP